MRNPAKSSVEKTPVLPIPITDKFHFTARFKKAFLRQFFFNPRDFLTKNLLQIGLSKRFALDLDDVRLQT